MSKAIIKIITLLNVLWTIFTLQKLFYRVKKIIVAKLLNFFKILLLQDFEQHHYQQDQTIPFLKT